MNIDKFTLTVGLLVLAIAAFSGCTGTPDTTVAAPTGPATNTTDQFPPNDMKQGGTLPNGTPPDGTAGMPQGGTPPSGTLPDSPGGLQAAGTPPAGSPPEGMSFSGNQSGGMPQGGQSSGGSPPGGMVPGTGSSSSTYALNGSYTIDGTTASKTGGTFTSDTTDVSAIYVTNGGTLTLNDPTIITSGDTSSNDASSFYGLNGAVLANGGSTVVIDGGTITTSGTGANGAIPTGTGTCITLSNMKITATGNGGHGVMATLGATLILKNVDISTAGSNGAPIATDRGSGTVTVTGGTITSSGADSPGIYSTGAITVNDAAITSTGTEAAVIEGFNSITLTNTSLTGGVAKTGGVMIYQSMSGDADVGTGSFTMNGGSYTATAGPAFFVTNTKAVITLKEVNVASASDTLISAAKTDRWGTSGKNGGTVTFIADDEMLVGNLVTDDISSMNATLQNGSTLMGSIRSAALTLDGTSSWNVTGDSTLTSLSDPAGISGTSVTNIVGNGHTVTYDESLAANSALGGKSYTLAGGGTLVPA